MKKKWLTLLLVFGTMAMAGIILVQLLWIRNAVKVSEDQFDQTVSTALKQVADKLEKKEAIEFLNQKMKLRLDTIITDYQVPPPPPPPRGKKPPKAKQIIIKDSIEIVDPFDEIFSFNMDSQITANIEFFNDWIEYSLPPGVSIHDSIKTWQQRISINFPTVPRFPKPPGQIIINHSSSSFFEDQEKLHGFEVTENHKERLKLEQEVSKLNRKVTKMKDAVNQMVVEVKKKDQGVENRIDSVVLKTELNKALHDAGLELKYEYAILKTGKDSLTPLHSLNFDVQKAPDAYKTSLFPDDLFSKTGQLVLYFPQKQKHILKSISFLMGASLIFTLALLLSFLATVIIILRQKKLSEIKNDFINNMTHEFKTPIATISLATDSINNPRVIQDPEMIRNYTRVIREENQRMNTHVEQVLQMALLDRGQIRLDRQMLDAHELVSRAVENILLQVDRKEGSIHLLLEAEQYMIAADEIHLFNAVLNLLDNANKYSPEKPEIKVHTLNQGHWLIIAVEDKGIGMNRETQKKIFEKFYRVHTGNLHNVKGFGLGLSYVTAIIDAHHGKISVHSEPGKGSRFEIKLPLV
ncbi:MAG: sensor histidine kinase [Bacteroidales bacterium]